MGITAAFGAASRGFGGDSLSRDARIGEGGRQVGRNGTCAHAAVARREVPQWVGSMNRAGLVADPAHEGIDYSFSKKHFPFNIGIKIFLRKYLGTSKNYFNFPGRRLPYLAQLFC
jgi:hypothetical protein